MRIIESSFKELYEEYRASGLSVRDFCSNQNFAVSTFYSWKKKLEQKECTPEFIPLHIGNQVVASANKVAEATSQNDEPLCQENNMEFTFPNGTKLHINGQVDLALLTTIVHLY